MKRKYFRFGDTVFCLESKIPLMESEKLNCFNVKTMDSDYEVKIRWAGDDEETPDSWGYTFYQRDGNSIFLAVNAKKLSTLTEWRIFIMLPVTGLLLEQGAVLLHASYVLHKGRAILFCGPSQIGKSTQAGLWEKCRGARVINGDRTLLFTRDGHFMAGGHFNCGTSGICENETAPVAAIVLLGQGNENKVHPVRGGEAFCKLLSQSTYDVHDREEIEMATALIAELVSRTKVLSLICCKEESAVEELEKYL